MSQIAANIICEASLHVYPFFCPDKREEDDVIPDSLPTSNHQHITIAVHQKSQR